MDAVLGNGVDLSTGDGWRMVHRRATSWFQDGCYGRCVTKADLHRLVDAVPEDVVQRIEHGGPVTFVLMKVRGQLELREIDPQQAWFWTPEWQEGEREADEDIAAGRGTRYNSDVEFLAGLKAELKPLSE
jgi:hypothetical protein